MTLEGLPTDRQLGKRLAKQARTAARAHEQSVLVHRRREGKRVRRAAKARRRLPVEVALAAGATLASVPAEGPVAVVAVVGAGLFGVRVLRSVSRLRRRPVPAPVQHDRPPLAPPPPTRSVAFPPVRRLEAVRLQLERLLPLVSPAGRDVADQAWRAAGEADAALRWQAARLAAVEPHGGTTSATVATLLTPLLAGVAAQERLVAAVAELVAASANPFAGDRLQDATDAVHGLAQGLRELR